MALTSSERTLTQIDHVRLTRLMTRAKAANDRAASFDQLEELLGQSDPVASPAVPANVVTMYSQVLLARAGESAPYYKVTLCYPQDAEPSRGFVSVLSPLGTSLLGLRVGDTAQWFSPHGEPKSALVMAILFQPEASGDYTT